MPQAVAAEKRLPRMVPQRSAKARKLRAGLTRSVTAFFRQQAPLITAQIARLRKPLNKGNLSQDEKDALDQIVAGIDFVGWSALTGSISDLIAELVADGAYAALA